MSSIINNTAAVATAKAELAEEAFKEAVAYHKKRIQTRRQHFLPKKIVFQSPIKFIDWVDSSKKTTWNK